MQKKVLILGSTGMLGHQVYYHFKEKENFEVVNVSYRNKLTPETIILDLNNKFALEKLLIEQKPDFVINCVGVLIKGANDNPANAIYLNAYLPHLLTGICDEMNAKLIHISTDCVFSGRKGNYSEDDEKDGRDIYSKTKALGEVETSPHVTLRTSIVGPELKEDGEGLFQWFMKQKGEVNGYNNAFWGGVTTFELAKCISKVLYANLEGLVHVTNGDRISKYKLLSIFKEVYNKKDIEIKEFSGKFVDKSLVKSKKFEFDIPSYEDMVLEQKKWMDKQICLYKNYSNFVG